MRCSERELLQLFSHHYLLEMQHILLKFLQTQRPEKKKTKNLILLKDTKFMKEISWRVHIETFLLVVVDPEG